MKRTLLQYIALLLCFVVAAAGLTFSSVSAQSAKRIGTVTHNELRVRDGAGTVGTNTLGFLYTGAIVTILDETTVGSTVWYKINCNVESGNVTGWSSGDYIKVQDLAVDGTYEEYLKEQGFPESYWGNLSVLHAMYPNWQFIAIDTNLDWNDVVAAETQLGKKLVYYNSPDYYINKNDVNEYGQQIGRDGPYWVAASSNIVQYYLDPRNFLSDPYIFMFESQSYDATAQTVDGVENIIKNTFMKADNTFVADGVTYTHAQAIMEAAQVSGVSAYHLASRMRQEQGTTGSSLSFGTVSGYVGYYNYFNYGAYPHSGNSSLVNGAIYASTVSSTYYGPWINPLRAIKGGAKLLGKNYINLGQDTVYFQNFNVVYSGALFSNQYMTNVQAGETESQTLRNAYDETTIQGKITFKIPVFDNMPAQACSKTGSGSVTPTPPVTPDPEPEPVSDPTVANGKYYYFTDGRISAVNIGATVSEFISKTGIANGSVGIFTAAGSSKTSGTMKTGDIVKLYRTDGSEYASYTVVLWGDVNGDGTISLADLLKVKRQVVGEAELGGWYKVAGDINGDGSVGLSDLLRLKQHIVGKKQITQTR